MHMRTSTHATYHASAARVRNAPGETVHRSPQATEGQSARVSSRTHIPTREAGHRRNKEGKDTTLRLAIALPTKYGRRKDGASSKGPPLHKVLALTQRDEHAAATGVQRGGPPAHRKDGSLVKGSHIETRAITTPHARLATTAVQCGGTRAHHPACHPANPSSVRGRQVRVGRKPRAHHGAKRKRFSAPRRSRSHTDVAPDSTLAPRSQQVGRRAGGLHSM
ncbi:hypothetical protein DFH09DRAFT_355231 [Mycena vulgaris]|nr:hypothetical protein DFH09DRAFT_355231 [Mycena vulgaris]